MLHRTSSGSKMPVKFKEASQGGLALAVPAFSGYCSFESGMLGSKVLHTPAVVPVNPVVNQA